VLSAKYYVLRKTYNLKRTMYDSETFFDILEEVIEREDNSRDVVGLEITSESWK